MDCEYFIDTTLLSHHVVEIEQEKRTAQNLHDEIAHAKLLADDSFADEFNKLLDKAESLIQFFSALATAMDNTSIEAEITIGKIRDLILDNRFDSARVFDFDVL